MDGCVRVPLNTPADTVPVRNMLADTLDCSLGLTEGEHAEFDLPQALFDAYNTKNEMIELNHKLFYKFVLNPKEYSLVVLFPVSEQEIYKDTELFKMVKSLRRSPVYENKLFFGIVDLKDKVAILKKLKYVPLHALVHFPPSGKLRKADVFCLAGGQRRMEDIKDWIERRTLIITNPHPIVSLVYALPEEFETFLFTIFTKESMAAAAVVYTTFMLSGDRWTRMHEGEQLYYNNDDDYISKDFREQFPVEGYIVMVLLLMSVIGLIIMIEGTAMNINRPVKKTVQFTGCVLFHIFFMLMMMVYKIKTSD